MSSIFRPEVLNARHNSSHGTIVLLRPLGFSIYALFSAITLAGLCALLLLGSYTKKARLTGLLTPEAGVARVVAPTSGVVTKVHATEGAEVNEGAHLLTLDAAVETVTSGQLHRALEEKLAARRVALTNEANSSAKLFRQQRESLSRRLDMYQREMEQLQREIELQRLRVESSEQQLARHRDLHAKQFLSDLQLQQRSDELLDQKTRLQALLRTQTGLERDVVAIQAELRALPLNLSREESSSNRGINSLDQERIENDARGTRLVVAPSPGRVSTVLAQVGASVSAGQTMLLLMPADMKLQAHLYATSRSIAFIEVGQRVMLRYHAFPYQKFGQYPGVISSVSRTVIATNELPSGIPSVSNSGEGMFRVTVQIDKQSVSAFGKAQALQSGMLVEADVIQDRRKLIEWVFEPLLSLRGRFE